MTPKLFVLDTNVLMHDPAALFKFQENDVYIPIVVLEELDNHKKGSSEVARNVRQVSRYLDELLAGRTKDGIELGIPLEKHGKLYLQTALIPSTLEQLPGNTPDNSILNTVNSLQALSSDKRVILVSKDINLRLKAKILGLYAEDYRSDQVLEDADLLYTGIITLPESIWQESSASIHSWRDKDTIYYSLRSGRVREWNPGLCISIGENIRGIVSSVDGDVATFYLIKNYTSHSVWGIKARNEEQNFALNLLLNPDIDFISLLGHAGTGKTLLTLAAALEQTLNKKLYKEIIVTRVTVPVGDDIGFLPGSEEEKMTPWMGAVLDNLEVLNPESSETDWGKGATAEFLKNKIKIRSLNYMRGRTFLGRFLILDEAQNLTSKQMKTLITRAGPGTKIVCLGNISQIDTPYLTETTSGLTYVVDRFKQWKYSGHITLMRGERSRLADEASRVL